MGDVVWPCRMELPYVQKLSEQMKESKDALILTLNIDEELGLVEPFMKENKYTFTVIPRAVLRRRLGRLQHPAQLGSQRRREADV